MSLQTRLSALITAIGADVKSLNTSVTTLTARPQYVVLGPTDPIPGGTPANSVILRKLT